MVTNTEWQHRPFEFIGIYSKNTLNYLISEIACVIYGITIVPIYDTLGEDSTVYIFE